MDALKFRLTEEALSAGFSRIRFADGGPFGFAGRSILIGAFPFDAEPRPVRSEGIPVAEIAPFARGNYYYEAVVRLKAMYHALFNEAAGEGKDFRPFSNSGFPERAIAADCGLGTIGRNGLIATPELGSLCILAGAVLPFSLKTDPPIGPRGIFGGFIDAAGSESVFFPCEECGACLAACPTKALGSASAPSGSAARDSARLGPGRIFRKEKCLQFWASRFEELPPVVLASWGARLYGCTICQDVCPLNRRTDETRRKTETGESVRGWIGVSLPIRFLTDRDEAELIAYFKGTALGQKWISKKALQRNALLALRNFPATAIQSHVAPFLATGAPVFVQAIHAVIGA
jgi:epoxyqueuosine reductase